MSETLALAKSVAKLRLTSVDKDFMPYVFYEDEKARFVFLSTLPIHKFGNGKTLPEICLSDWMLPKAQFFFFWVHIPTPLWKRRK